MFSAWFFLSLFILCFPLIAILPLYHCTNINSNNFAFHLSELCYLSFIEQVDVVKVIEMRILFCMYNSPGL
jgi:hypothetical protein